MVNEKKMLYDALSYAQIPHLPSEWDGKNIWAWAIARVRKKDMEISYALVQNRIGRKFPKFQKVFGSVAAIHEILNIYPILMLDSQYIFKAKTKDEAVVYLQSKFPATPFEDIANLSKTQIVNLIYNLSIDEQIEKFRSDKVEREMSKTYATENRTE